MRTAGLVVSDRSDPQAGRNNHIRELCYALVRSQAGSRRSREASGQCKDISC